MKEICIKANGDIKWKNINDRERIELITIKINDEIFDILSNEKTPIKEVRKIVNDIVQGILDYE